MISTVSKTLAIGIAALGVAGALGTANAQQGPETREIIQVKDNVYHYRSGFYNMVFAVTPEGVILVDTHNVEAAEWLKAELKSRFNAEVKYLIYSHDHADHITGGEVFADTAVIIAHEQAKEDIIGDSRPTAVPDLTYKDTMTIELGGTVAELNFLGRSHSDNMTIVRFPKEGVIIAVDVVQMNSIGFGPYSDAYFPDFIDSLKRIEAMDFDIVIPGHGAQGDRSNVTAYRLYIEDLRGQVQTLVRAGKSLEEIQAEVDLTKYKDWALYGFMRDANVAGMYSHITRNRIAN
jgi:glyoxylase-like metal-dependent hydrolase (beta-lactamase superfamily II)